MILEINMLINVEDRIEDLREYGIDYKDDKDLA